MSTIALSLRFSLALTATLTVLSQGCVGPVDESIEDEAVGEAAQAVSDGGTLVLVPGKEKKISTLFGSGSSYAASGVQMLGSDLYVIFDNKNQVAKIPTALGNGTATYTPGTLSSSDTQYEGITFDSYSTQHFYLVQEVNPAMVAQLDATGSAQGESYQSTGVTFSSANKGFEGIAWLRRNNNDYLLALCEAGDCGSEIGTAHPGRIKILAQSGSSWSDVGYMRLCADVGCTSGLMNDYSDIALRPMPDGSYKVAVTSQESQQLWIGTLSATSWSLSTGTLYHLPSTDYCNIEGVTFLSDTRFALVSDEMKAGQDPSCNNKDESVHLFDLP
jgi:hypothetical protein